MKTTNKLQIALAVRAKAVKRYKDSTLQNYCAVCSMALMEAFKKAGFTAKLVYGKFYAPYRKIKYWWHVWVESDGEIYDITAKQFGARNPEILVTMKTDNRYIVDVKTIRSYGYFRGWDTYNRPTLERTRELLVA